MTVATQMNDDWEGPNQGLAMVDLASVDQTDIESDDSDRVHDQLPSPEEIRMESNSRGLTPAPRSHYVFIVAAIVMVAVATILIVNFTGKSSDGTGNSVSSRLSLESVVEYLAGIGVSAEDDLLTPGTPQFEAVNWMANDDGFGLEIPTSTIVQSRFVERYILAVLYFATGGDDWTDSLRFLRDTDHCYWYTSYIHNNAYILNHGVEFCEDVTESAKSQGGHMVGSLYIPYNGLSGQLPSEIQHLRSLSLLIINQNTDLVGTIPTELGAMTSLVAINLDYNSLTGSIPSEIGDCRKLTFLSASNNNLEGDIPESIFTLTDMELFALDDCGVSGNIAYFAAFSKLEGLYLEDNLITGTLTESLVDQWSSLIMLDMSDNLMGSSLPASLFLLENLAVIDLHGNSFVGSLPDIVEENSALVMLALHENLLTGTIPTSIANLKALSHLDLAINELVSPIPATLGSLTDLKYLFIGENDFSGQPIPAFLQKLDNLVDLSLKSSSMTGSIPSFIGALTKLGFLDLDSNELTGPIPAEFGLLTSLDHLLLNRNNLTGTIPVTFTVLYDLDLLLIDDNSLTGTADVICSDKDIEVLVFTADCVGDDAEIKCSCCSECCDDTNATCNNYNWRANLDPIWENDYGRDSYTYDIGYRDDNETRF
eukprot:Nitzschia sp. Nitz4//scaffold35_size145790//25199//27331//NITZ4_003011-RA/size145790-augustus-gene-0.129-mRNA-1//-1//CDS//3329549067//3338//frame0